MQSPSQSSYSYKGISRIRLPSGAACRQTQFDVLDFLREGDYQGIIPDADGLLKSRIFRGLWLDAAALLRGDMKTVLATLRRGLESPDHQAFLAT